MAKTEAVAICLRLGGATNKEVDDFLDFYLFRDQGDTARYECSRLWESLLRYRETPYKKYDHFDFDEILKDNIRSVTNGEIVDANPPANAVIVSCENFVKFVVPYLDESF